MNSEATSGSATRWPYLDACAPIAFAHRGGGDAAVENTIPAFRHAASLGYTYLETDVRCTADGVLVIFHDPDLQRLAGRADQIADLAWSELSQIDLGGGATIPRLVDLLDAFPHARFNIDLKSEDTFQPFIDLITERPLLDRIAVASFSDERVEAARRVLGPRLCTAPGKRGVVTVLLQTLLPAGLARRWFRAEAHPMVQLPGRRWGLRLGRLPIRRMQALGYEVHVWTINALDDMEFFLDAGVDGIITDRVVTLKEVLTRREMWPATSQTD